MVRMRSPPGIRAPGQARHWWWGHTLLLRPSCGFLFEGWSYGFYHGKCGLTVTVRCLTGEEHRG